jgi:hypothetical protein
VATDGVAGKLRELYFVADQWRVEYLVTRTGNWVSGPDVLISPSVVRAIHDSSNPAVEITLTCAQVESSLLSSTREPVSQQLESKYHRYPEWIGEREREAEPDWIPDVWPKNHSNGAGARHLQSTETIMGYQLETPDGRVGYVVDFIVDDSIWQIRYLVVSARHWLPGRKVLVSTDQVGAIDWAHSAVQVHCGQAAILGAPDYDPRRTISRDYEKKVVSHYFSGGWSERSLAI